MCDDLNNFEAYRKQCEEQNQAAAFEDWKQRKQQAQDYYGAKRQEQAEASMGAQAHGKNAGPVKAAGLASKYAALSLLNDRITIVCADIDQLGAAVSDFYKKHSGALGVHAEPQHISVSEQVTHRVILRRLDLLNTERDELMSAYAIIALNTNLE